MSLDTSTITRHVATVHTVDDQGGPVELVESTHARYSCAAHGLGWNDWQDARAHCEAFHAPGASNDNQLPADGTDVGEGVSVGLEAPSQ